VTPTSEEKGSTVAETEKTTEKTETTQTTERQYVPPVGSEPVQPDPERPHPPEPQPEPQPDQGPTLPGEGQRQPNQDDEDA
jgi:hypothetical protein